MTTCFGFNILDTAQLRPDDVMLRLSQTDAAMVTIIEATHPKEARALLHRIRSERPKVAVVYRIWRQDLPDETAWERQTPEQWIERFREPLEAGAYCALWNESLFNPMSVIAEWDCRVLDITAPRKWRTAHFKVPTGNPGLGINRDGRPDGYAEFDTVWDKIGQANKPEIDAGRFPLAFVGPHSYFKPTGPAGGMTERHREVHRRVNELALLYWKAGKPSAHLKPLYVPLFLGETGTTFFYPDGHLDPDKGYKECGLSGAQFANLFASINKSHYIPDRAIPHLYAMGESAGKDAQGRGRWWSFNTMEDTDFWQVIVDQCYYGHFNLPFWYGDGIAPPPPPEPTPEPPPPTQPPPADYVTMTIEQWIELRNRFVAIQDEASEGIEFLDDLRS